MGGDEFTPSSTINYLSVGRERQLTTTYRRCGALDRRYAPESRPAAIGTNSCPAAVAPILATHRAVDAA